MMKQYIYCHLFQEDNKINITIKISKKKLYYDTDIMNDNIGALVSFSGIIKGCNNNKKVKEILYVVFNKLFISTLKKYCISIIKNKKEINIYINQFTGTASVGTVNLIITVKAKDRKNAFSMCHKILEFIKNNAPIWKKEIYSDGTSKWINA